LTDRAIDVEQALTEFVQCGAALEDEVVAELDLREEQPVPATRSEGCGQSNGTAIECCLCGGRRRRS
jgi:hypothetical protein